MAAALGAPEALTPAIEVEGLRKQVGTAQALAAHSFLQRAGFLEDRPAPRKQLTAARARP